MIWDTHAHLDDKRFHGDLSEVLERARTSGISRILNPGYDLESSRRSVALAREYSFICAAVGIHPHDAQGITQETWDILLKLTKEPKVVAWGEIGLDYYRDLSPRSLQKEAFVQQIELANSARLPIIIHNREAHQDVLRLVKEHPPRHGGVLHVYSGSWEMAKEWLDLGFYLSFGGPLTYKNARQTVEVAEHIPLERFMVETDAPYLTPEPYRGKRNEPSYVREVVQRIADIRRLDLEKVAERAMQNAESLFGTSCAQG
ncbi:MAG: TatD family hydrolase [Desulfitobacteriaceae bacterium]